MVNRSSSSSQASRGQSWAGRSRLGRVAWGEWAGCVGRVAGQARVRTVTLSRVTPRCHRGAAGCSYLAGQFGRSATTYKEGRVLHMHQRQQAILLRPDNAQQLAHQVPGWPSPYACRWRLAQEFQIHIASSRHIVPVALTFTLRFVRVGSLISGSCWSQPYTSNLCARWVADGLQRMTQG